MKASLSSSLIVCYLLSHLRPWFSVQVLIFSISVWNFFKNINYLLNLSFMFYITMFSSAVISLVSSPNSLITLFYTCIICLVLSPVIPQSISLTCFLISCIIFSNDVILFFSSLSRNATNINYEVIRNLGRHFGDLSYVYSYLSVCFVLCLCLNVFIVEILCW